MYYINLSLTINFHKASTDFMFHVKCATNSSGWSKSSSKGSLEFSLIYLSKANSSCLLYRSDPIEEDDLKMGWMMLLISLPNIKK